MKQTQKQYLFDSGVLENGNKQEIDLAKKTYRLTYIREKKRAFRQKHRTVSLSFPIEQAKMLEHRAKEQYDMKLSGYIKACAMTYLRQEYLVPNPQQVHALTMQIQQVGNNLNQLVRYSHSGHVQQGKALEEAREIVAQLEKEVLSYISKPPRLSVVLKNTLDRNPEYCDVLQRLIDSVRQNQQ